MTIEKGQDWGSVGPLAPDAPIVDSDRALAALIATSEPGRSVEAGLTGGDLARTVGATGPDVDWSAERARLPIDAGVALVDGARHHFVANIVVRRADWRGPITIVANAAHLGDWIVAPRNHPNDGRFVLLRADLSLADKIKARGRLRSGSHLPHPQIDVRSTTSGEIEVASGARVFIDGVSIGRAGTVTFEVVPDAAVVVV